MTFECPVCQKRIVADVSRENEVECPSCRRMVSVPETSTEQGTGPNRAVVIVALVSICVVLVAMVATLWPGLSRSWTKSRRPSCSSLLKGLGTSLRIYATESENWFPPDLETLVRRGDITMRELHCPDSGAAPDDPMGSYVYIAGLTRLDEPRPVLVYDKKKNHGGKGGNVLYVDGSIAFLTPYSKVEAAAARSERHLMELGRSP